MKAHRHKCEGCGLVGECFGVVTHATRCGPCFNKMTDRILFGNQEGFP